MRPLRIVVADDEPVARQRLRRLLEARADCRLVGEFADGVVLAAGLNSLDVDLVLLDIDMPGPDGFASLGALADPKPLIVFVTAFAEFASRAYDVDAVDYLLKPVSAARLDEALTRTARRLQLRDRGADAAPMPVLARFVAQGRTYLFEQSKISTVRASGNYAEITTDTQRVELRTSLNAAHTRLNPDEFIRVHRSWIIARTAVAQVTSLPGSRCEILLKDGRRVPGGRAFSQTIAAVRNDRFC